MTALSEGPFGEHRHVRGALRMAGRRFPWRIVCQVFTAIVGGYLFANVAGITLAKTLPVFRGDAVSAGFLLAFVFYTVAVMWVFSFRSLLKGCGGLWLATALLGWLSWVLEMPGMAT